ncbi:hypothetical protein Droror1_Dr00020220 [Drosera rotundifolia]
MTHPFINHHDLITRLNPRSPQQPINRYRHTNPTYPSTITTQPPLSSPVDHQQPTKPPPHPSRQRTAKVRTGSDDRVRVRRGCEGWSEEGETAVRRRARERARRQGGFEGRRVTWKEGRGVEKVSREEPGNSKREK